VKLLTLSARQPVGHIEVLESSWFFMNRLRAEEASDLHDHNFLEIAFVLRGHAQHFVVQGEERCKAGDVFVIPVGAWHGYSAGANLELVNCLLSPVMCERELAWIRNSPVGDLLGLNEPKGFASVRKLSVPPARLGELRRLLRELEVTYRRGGTRAGIVGRLLTVVDFIQQKGRRATASDAFPASVHPAIRQAIELMYDGIAEEWTLERLAERLRLSSSYLVRLFHAQTGSAPMKFLAKTRAERAATLLLSENLRVSEVGVAVGWPEPKRFADSFHRHFGMSASAYREKMRRG
jgi:AraC-like DNA-binding protein